MAARFKKSREASLVRADGVVWSRNFLTTPPRPLHQRSFAIFFLNVAAPSCCSGGEPCPNLQALPYTSISNKSRPSVMFSNSPRASSPIFLI